MHHPPYTPSQGHPLQPELHQLPPHQAPYSQHSMQPLPPMPPLSTQYAENPQMGAPPPAPPGPSDGTPGSAQDRAPLTSDQKKQQEQNLKPYSSSDGSGRLYSLVVVQQPQRARMCGFGDKDRRPITPPPCVKLIVRDAASGKEIDCNHIEHTMYVLNVDLWSEDAIKEVNLVRHTTATPSISSTTPASYAAIEQSTPAFSHILPSNRDIGYPQQMPYQASSPAVNAYAMQSPYSAGGYVSPNGSGYAPANQYYPDFRPDMQSMSQLPGQVSPYGPPRMYDGGFALSQRLSISGNSPTGMFTRNLIGSLAASAFRLSDPDDKIGIWFVLQDLSVRTEGNFRLRFSFVNVGAPGVLPNGQQSGGNPSVNSGKAPVLASVFSDVFQVYSAKKFPGVCESTQLSKCFATQGIKIPIRKEGQNAKGGGGEDDDGDY